MPDLTTVVGELTSTAGARLQGATVAFTRVPAGLVTPIGGTDLLLAPKVVSATSGSSGTFSAAMVPGRYSVRITVPGGTAYAPITVDVPDSASPVRLEDLMTVPQDAPLLGAVRITAAPGSAAEPSYGFADDAMGLFRPEADTLGFATGGAERMRLTNAALSVSAASLQVGGSEVYRRADLVGTVSQSGGTPTGAAVQRGSGANGSFVRFADGTQMCWHVVTASESSGVTWTFPAAFSAAPVVSGTAQASSVASAVVLDAAPTAEAATLSARGNNNARQQVFMHLSAVGRWF